VYALSFDAGGLHGGWVVERLARRAPALRKLAQLASSPAGDATGHGRATSEEAVKTVAEVVPDVLASTAESFHLRSALYLDRFRNALGGRDLRFYASSPRLAIASMETKAAGPPGKLLVGITLDLRRNDLRVVARDPARKAQWENILRGILDGALEHAMSGRAWQPVPETLPHLSTAAVVERAQADGVPIVAFTSSADLQSLQAPADMKARMLADAGADTVLVAPVRPVLIDGRARLAWWRIDLSTGETVGVTDTGLHAGGTELLTTGQKVELFVVGSIMGVFTVPFAAAMTYFSILVLEWLACATGSRGCPPDYSQIPTRPPRM
ncbi:MAG: hypothetical protein ACREJR_02975, partial [Candidatus Rokuibacteriota bacterium]